MFRDLPSWVQSTRSQDPLGENRTPRDAHGLDEDVLKGLGSNGRNP